MSDPLPAVSSRPLEGGPSFSLRHRLARLTWNITWSLCASWTPPVMRPWRRFLLRLFGAKISATAVIYGTAKIWHPANLTVGDHACIGGGATIYSMAPITLEAWALVSQGAYLCAGTHDIDDPDFQLVTAPIVVGERAWIAAEAFVGPGVSVGAGAVLGARAVAFRDLEPWGVYVGNPAKRTRTRKRAAKDSQA
ncbi:MAG: putative colanic acid biosynthesis acetyltransferase [Alphaproteobacteria bacterium]|nr:putative colanic acid biosynthesis acetyltransferase [Alphaproteobacteria bacterium]MBU2378739.1 putative colanic acid biosynthesis acetyltransferase [Alphaproteobacteria bacterium]